MCRKCASQKIPHFRQCANVCGLCPQPSAELCSSLSCGRNASSVSCYTVNITLLSFCRRSVFAFSFGSFRSFYPSYSRSAGAPSSGGTAAFPVLFGALLHLGFVFAMPLLEFLHSSGVIEQSQFHTAQQMFQVEHSLVGKDPANSIRGLGTFVQPIQRLLAVELNGSGNCKRIVRTDLLDEFTIPGRTGIGYYDEIKRPFLRPVALQSDFNWHFK